MDAQDLILNSPMDYGGQGVLWLAENRAGETLMVRFLPAQLDPRTRHRLDTLLRLGKNLPANAPLMRVKEVIPHEGRTAVVSPYYQGSTLAAALTRSHVLPDKKRLQVARDVAQALVLLHGAGLAHTDISSQNVIVTNAGAVVIDLLEEGGYTPTYCDPKRLELARNNEHVDLQTLQQGDWWSWAVLCDELGVEVTVAKEILKGSVPDMEERVKQWLEVAEVGQVGSHQRQIPVEDILRSAAVSERTVRFRSGGKRRKHKPVKGTYRTNRRAKVSRARAGRRKAVSSARVDRGRLVGAGISLAMSLLVLGWWWSGAYPLGAMRAMGAATSGDLDETGQSQAVDGDFKVAAAAPVSNVGLDTDIGEDVKALCPTMGEAEGILRQLTAQKRQMLETGDLNMLSSIYADVEGVLADSDRQLLADLNGAGASLGQINAEFEVTAVKCEPVVVEFRSHNGGYQLCTSAGCQVVSSAPAQCVSMTLSDPPWRIVSIEPGECR
ncbi:MAG: protein kinase [Actinomycetaceae bacterium]|nr:protein kinase [Actinomycetaceae bacterium]